MHDLLIRRLASNGKVKSAATRGPGFSWLGSAPQAGVFTGFQYLTPPLAPVAHLQLESILAAGETDTPEQEAADLDGVFARLARETAGIQDIDTLVSTRREAGQ